MGTLEIHCHHCGAVYEVTSDLVREADKLPPDIIPYRCTHCMNKMEPRLWDKLVFAFWVMEEANKDIRKDHDEYDRPHRPMQAAYKTHYVEQDRILI